MSVSPVSALVHAVAVLSWYQPTPIKTERAIHHAKSWIKKARMGSVPASFRGFLSEVSDSEEDDFETAIIEAMFAGVLDVDGDTLTLIDQGHALEVRPQFDSRNLTAQWVDEFFTAARYKDLNKFLGARIVHSRDQDEVMELGHEFIRRLINADSLRKRLLAGSTPLPSEIKSWAWRRVLTIFRDEGTDAQTRTIKNSRTDRDLQNNTPAEAFKVDPNAQFNVVYEDGENDTRVMSDVVEVSPQARIEHTLYARQQVERIRATIAKTGPAQRARYERMLGYLQEGMGVAEIAAAEGVSRNRAAILLADLRKTCQRAEDQTEGAAVLLDYLQNEPFATLSDLRSVVDEAEVVLPRLVAAGAVERRGESYLYLRHVAL
jgi:hypothetical protein